MKKNNIPLVIIDIIMINVALFTAFYLKFEGDVQIGYYQKHLFDIAILSFIKIAVYFKFNFYRNLWKYASIDELFQIISAAFISNAAAFIYLVLKQSGFMYNIYTATIILILDMFFLGMSRFSYRINKRIIRSGKKTRKENNVMVVGAGDAGASVIRELKNSKQLNYRLLAIIDDDKKKHGQRINGIPVLGGREDITNIAKKKMIDEIIIAIPSAGKKDLWGIMKECKKTKCKLKTLPGIFDLIEGKVSIKDIRDVQIEDLLGREEIELDIEEISGYLKGKKVLVTGGGGSIGAELCKQIAKFAPEELDILDIYENNVYELQNELKEKYKELNLQVLIASIRDRERISEIMELKKPHVVFHAAAHKHVPLMEQNPKEAIKNNVLGTLNVAQAAHKNGVFRFILISTDKAVNPTNVMGASKRICEMIIQSINTISPCKFAAVRFGNVLGSSGSVVPLFNRQILQGGPVTVTHPEVTRYFMTIAEAAQLVIQAGAIIQGGEIFILNMGQPVKIIRLAEDLIRLSGYAPYEDIPICITGLRPGEKLYEELLLAEEGIEPTSHEKILKCKPVYNDYTALLVQIEKLKELVQYGTDQKLKEHIAGMVPCYSANYDPSIGN